MAQQQLDAEAIAKKLFDDLSEVQSLNKSSLAETHKVVDVSDMKSDGTGIKKIAKAKTQKSTKKTVESFPLLASNNWANYNLATQIIGWKSPEFKQIADLASQQFQQQFGVNRYEKPKAAPKVKGTRKQKAALNAAFNAAEKAKAAAAAPVTHVYVDPVAIGMSRVKSPGLTSTPIVATPPLSDLSRPLVKIPVGILNEQQLNISQRAPSPVFSPQTNPIAYQANEQLIDYLTQLQTLDDNSRAQSFSRLSQQQQYTFNTLYRDLMRKVTSLQGKDQDVIRAWYLSQSPATQRWYQAYVTAVPQQRSPTFVPRPTSPTYQIQAPPPSVFVPQQLPLPISQPSSPRGLPKTLTESALPRLPNLEASQPISLPGLRSRSPSSSGGGLRSGNVTPVGSGSGRISSNPELASGSGSGLRLGNVTPVGSGSGRISSNPELASGSGSGSGLRSKTGSNPF